MGNGLSRGKLAVHEKWTVNGHRSEPSVCAPVCAYACVNKESRDRARAFARASHGMRGPCPLSGDLFLHSTLPACLIF